MTSQSSTSQLPPVPRFVFRGHVAAIHALHFFAANAFLASGDSGGWVVVWSLTSKRPVAVWKGHESGVMAIKSWGSVRLITHGRDHKLRVWRLEQNDLEILDVKLPVDGADAKSNREPWLLHSMSMNALNFCAFAMCYEETIDTTQSTVPDVTKPEFEGKQKLPRGWGKPADEQGASVQADGSAQADGSVQADESAPVDESVQADRSAQVEKSIQADRSAPVDGSIQADGYAQVHGSAQAEESKKQDQPQALSLYDSYEERVEDVVPPERNVSEQQSATAVQASENQVPVLIAAPNGLDQGGIDFFHLPSERRLSRLPSDERLKPGMVMAIFMFYHPVSHDLRVVSGYEDGSTQVNIRQRPSSKGEQWKWLRVLDSKSHTQPILSIDMNPSREIYFTSAADAIVGKVVVPMHSLIHKVNFAPLDFKTVNTKHAGQQSLCVRSDGKLFATAGWDKRVRVYSVKTMRELAVLKWHQDGCYAVAFAEIDPVLTSSEEQDRSDQLVVANMNQTSALDIIKAQRRAKAQTTHWLAAGGKDGKISLWDIY